MPRKDILVLDFDGVVLDSVDIKTRAFRELYRHRPEHLEAITRLHQDNGGLSRYEKFRRIHREILDEPLDETELARLGERFAALVLDEVLRCPFIPGAEDFLRQESARRPVWVASGTPQEELRGIVRRRGLEGYFREVFGSPAAKADILQGILCAAGVGPDQAVFVGDATTDLRAAQAVGMPFVGLVAPGRASPFPPGTPVVPDLRGPLPEELLP